MRKFTLAFVSMLFSLGAIAETVTVYGIGAQLASSDLNEKTESTMIAIKNLSATNHYYYVGNTGAAPYSKADFNEAAVFVWEPVTEGTPGSYYLRKLDGTYMQKSAPKDFGTKDNAAVFTTTNPTSTGSGSTKFNSDKDSQAYINNDNDNPNLVRFVNEAGTWINVQNGDSGTPTYNSGLGGWTIHYVYAVDEKAGEQLTYNLTDKAGNIFVGSYEGLAGTTKPTLTGTPYSLSNEAWEGATFTAEIEFPFPVSKVDGATNATLLSIYNNAQQWHAVDGNVLVQTAGANLAELDYWMWAIYPAFNDGAFTFTIKNIATGLFVTANKTGSNLDTSNNNNTGADGAVTLTETGTAFSIPSERDFAFTINDVTAYLSINSDKDTDVNLGVHTVAHNGTNVLTPSFADLSAYKVTIGSTGYSTLYTPIKVTVPAGITAYTGELNDEWLTLTEVENVIPANTAVVLQGDANTYTFSASSAEAAEIANNALKGSTETVATSSVEGTAYTLQSNGKGGVVFKKYTGTNLSGFKAYLDLPTEAAAIGIRFEDGTTAIDNVQLSTDNVVIYDLSGRRVEKMEKGIYIVNGKKVIR